uniref:EB domain-containing protein n=1 Tax=Ditylenchus dipsaci TaxID=166011 RepID=A0A915CZC9_9BILA
MCGWRLWVRPHSSLQSSSSSCGGLCPACAFCSNAPPPLPPAGRLIPQALPGAPCEPGVECTGGSVCSMGICLCPPELVQEGTVCVSRTIYGVVPPVPPPMPMPPPMPAFAAPPPMPYPMPAPIPVAYAPPPPPMMAGPACGCPFCEGCRGCAGPAFAAPCIRRRETQENQQPQFDDVPDSTEMGVE